MDKEESTNFSTRNFRPDLKRRLRVYAAQLGVSQEEALNRVVEAGLRVLQAPSVSPPV